MNDSDSFFGSANSSEHYASRPKSVNPRTGQEQSWQRASNYASPLDNPHGLIKWQLRELVKGISLRPDLARMLLTGAAIEDNAKADEIITAAHATAAIDAKANEGTAVHSALSRSFRGHEVPSEYMPHVRAFADELRRNGLEPIATEVRVLCILLGVIGHTDWIVRTADGRHLVLDVKTGKLSDARKFAVQCKAYGAAEYIDDGKGGWAPIPFTIDQTEAILAHVDPLTGATSLYRVDLVLGLYGATLAERVRDWGKIEVLSPYTPVHAKIPQTGALHPEHASVAFDLQHSAGLGSRIDPTTIAQNFDVDMVSREIAEAAPASIESVIRHEMETAPRVTDFVCRYDGRSASVHPIQTPDFHCITPVPHESLTNNAAFPQPERPSSPTAPDAVQQAEEARLQEIEQRQSSTVVGRVEVTEPRPASAETAIAAGEALNASVEAEKAELMKLDKAALQMKAKNEHGATDLAHNREWLACYIIAKRRGCDESAAVMYAKSKGTMKLGGAASFSRPQPSNEQLRSEPDQMTQASAAAVLEARGEGLGPDGLPRSSTEEERAASEVSFVFKAIEGAKSEGALEALRANIVERRGDQAWTDEMAAAARAKALELIAADGNAVGVEARTLARIAQATEPQHIAALWSEVTIGGSAPDNWTPELKASADRRLYEIHQAQPPTPANPYAPQH